MKMKIRIEMQSRMMRLDCGEDGGRDGGQMAKCWSIGKQNQKERKLWQKHWV